MALLNLIEEQCSFEFTGRINILQKENSQFLGHLLILDGLIVYCRLGVREGENSLFRAVIQDVLDLKNVKYIVEPEIVEESQRLFSLDISTLRRESEKALNSYKDGLKLRPKNDLRLLVKSEVMSKNIRLSPQEYDVIAVLTDYNKVEDLYEKCELFEDEITNALVSLRKKQLIKVIAAKENL